MEYPETPELDRMLAVREQSQQLGEFLEWLRADQHLEFCAWRDSGNNGQPIYISVPWPEDLSSWREKDQETLDEQYGRLCWEYKLINGEPRLVYRNPAYERWGEGFVPIHRTINAWLALYFGLDQEKMDRERDAVLAYVREHNNAGGR